MEQRRWFVHLLVPTKYRVLVKTCHVYNFLNKQFLPEDRNSFINLVTVLMWANWGAELLRPEVFQEMERSWASSFAWFPLGAVQLSPPWKFQRKWFAPGSVSDSVCDVGTEPGYPDSLFPILTTGLLTGYLVMQISLHNILSAKFCHEKNVIPNGTWDALKIEIVNSGYSMYSVLQMTHPTVRSYYNQTFVVKAPRWNDAVLIKWRLKTRCMHLENETHCIKYQATSIPFPIWGQI